MKYKVINLASVFKDLSDYNVLCLLTQKPQKKYTMHTDVVILRVQATQKVLPLVHVQECASYNLAVIC